MAERKVRARERRAVKHEREQSASSQCDPLLLGPAPVLRDFNTPVVFGQNGQADEMRTRSHGEKVNSGRDKLPETGRGTLALSYLLRGEIKRFAVCKQRRAMSLPAVNSSSRGTQCPRCQITLRARCAWREVNNAGSWFSPNSQWRSVKGLDVCFLCTFFSWEKKKNHTAGSGVSIFTQAAKIKPRKSDTRG